MLLLRDRTNVLSTAISFVYSNYEGRLPLLTNLNPTVKHKDSDQVMPLKCQKFF